MTLEGRTVLVIGRPGGIARAVTLAAREAGATVIVAGRDEAGLTAAYDGDPGVSVRHVDLTDEASVESLARSVQVDHVVSTASARARGAVAELDRETVLRSFEVKVVGPMLLAKHFAGRMPEDGSFVLFSGASARKPMPGMLAVGATNGAVDVVTRSLAVELAPVRVNAISPGTVDTGAYDGLGEQRKADLFESRSKHNPARRIGDTDDIAGAVIFALTNSFVTGQVIGVDGGEALV